MGCLQMLVGGTAFWKTETHLLNINQSLVQLQNTFKGNQHRPHQHLEILMVCNFNGYAVIQE